MKRALLWLCSLACVTVAGLYAYAWFNRDPVLSAYERLAPLLPPERFDASLQEAMDIVGQPPAACWHPDYPPEYDRGSAISTAHNGKGSITLSALFLRTGA